MFRLLFALLPFLALPLQENPPAGDPPKDPPGDPPKPDDPPKVTFSDEQQRELNRLIARETRKAAETEKAAAEAAQEATRKQAETEADRKKQEDAGEFEKVRTGIEQERDTFKGERDTLKGEHDALSTYFEAQYMAALKDLPDVVKAFAPAEDASFETKSKWLTTAQEQARKLSTTSPRGAGFNPAPGTRAFDVAQEAAKARASGKYRV